MRKAFVDGLLDRAADRLAEARVRAAFRYVRVAARLMPEHPPAWRRAVERLTVGAARTEAAAPRGALPPRGRAAALLWSALSDARLLQGAPDGARKAAARAAAAAPDWPPAARRHAQALRAAGRRREAAQAVRAAAASQRRWADVDVAIELWTLGDLSGAIEEASRPAPSADEEKVRERLNVMLAAASGEAAETAERLRGASWRRGDAAAPAHAARAAARAAAAAGDDGLSRSLERLVTEALQWSRAAGAFAALPAQAEALRDMRRRADARMNATPTVAMICPLHRADDLPNALAQLARQNIDEAAAILAVNNAAGLAEAARSARWTGRIPLQILDLGEVPNVASALNAAVDAATADLMIRFDADNLYFPDYARDLRRFAVLEEADVLGKRARFCAWQASGILDLIAPEQAFRSGRPGDWIAGGDTAFTRRAWRERPFDETLRSQEDVAFARAAVAAGRRLYLTDPFNAVSVRSADDDAHVSDGSALLRAYLQSGAILGAITDMERLARV